jgi:leucyl aminopeptidase
MGEMIHDYIWRLPITKDLVRKGIIADDNKYVDVINSDKDENMGSTIEGACFIYAFIPDGVKWVHFDIGGSKLDTTLLPVLRSILMII